MHTPLPPLCPLLLILRLGHGRHGRDNKLHVWQGVHELAPPRARALGGSAALPGLQSPQLRSSLDVNALNFCRFSLLSLPEGARADGRHALVAVPNLVESAHVRRSPRALLGAGCSVLGAQYAVLIFVRDRRTSGPSRASSGCTLRSGRQTRLPSPPTAGTSGTQSVRRALTPHTSATSMSQWFRRADRAPRDHHVHAPAAGAAPARSGAHAPAAAVRVRERKRYDARVRPGGQGGVRRGRGVGRSVVRQAACRVRYVPHPSSALSQSMGSLR